ncbi:MAG: DotU family type IV/VI secretion system protein [Verrucomicrobia bacterium]|nr:DotU family type IV/VI secretion system protein [Verrucomicrobiota bacterium]MBV8483153.1 DotU family type IV/VI secretion system protein [Verrucomicrobiota bacterium]
MTLLELCEPFFKKVCLLNRLARKGASLSAAVDPEKLRLEIKELFSDAQKRASAEPLLAAQWQKVELPMIFFIDSMIAECGLTISANWNRNRLAYERKELAGDEKFFDLLDDTLKDQSEEATERLQIFYTCLGLGFTGWYAGQNEYLRGKMLDISQRIGPAMDISQNTRICPEAYAGVDTRDLVQQPGLSIGVIAVIFLGLCFIVLSVETYLFRAASLSLLDSVTAIETQETTK